MSFKSRIIHLVMRYRHLLRGHIKREIIDKSTSIEKQRQNCDETAARMVRKTSDVKFVPIDYAKCYAEWVVPENANTNVAVLYFHGGDS